MGTPDIPNGLQIHAAAEIDDQTPPGVTGAVGIGAAGITRTGAGIWVVNLNEEIEALDRKAMLTAADAGHGYLALDTTVVTVSTIGVLGFIDGGANAYAAGDMNWSLMVFRVGIFL